MDKWAVRQVSCGSLRLRKSISQRGERLVGRVVTLRVSVFPGGWPREMMAPSRWNGLKNVGVVLLWEGGGSWLLCLGVRETDKVWTRAD
jgi:hypothetical protein